MVTLLWFPQGAGPTWVMLREPQNSRRCACDCTSCHRLALAGPQEYTDPSSRALSSALCPLPPIMHQETWLRKVL